jgi:predicted lipid-binding transport protein (Tim44 family)
MTGIVAGRFEQQTDAQAAIKKLLHRGFRRDDVSSFFVNPPGQHGRFPVGGDRNVSPGARGAGLGALAGGAIGGVSGLFAGIVLSHALGVIAIIVGVAAGAYLGVLAGALARLQDRRRSRRGKGTTEVRAAGIIVAAHTPTTNSRNKAVRALQSSGAVEVEAAKGHWRHGRWTDFDPTTPPTCVSVSTR